MVILALFAASLATAQVTVVVRDDETKLGLESATVEVFRDSKVIKRKVTDENGVAIIPGTAGYTGREIIQANADGHDGRSKDWSDITDPGEPIRFDLPPDRPRKMCTYTIQKVVRVTEPNGTVGCRAVFETRTVDCEKAPRYRLPDHPPPIGYRYQFAFAETHYDAQLRGTLTRAWYRTVPACQPDAVDSMPVVIPLRSLAPCECE